MFKRIGKYGRWLGITMPLFLATTMLFAKPDYDKDKVVKIIKVENKKVTNITIPITINQETKTDTPYIPVSGTEEEIDYGLEEIPGQEEETQRQGKRLIDMVNYGKTSYKGYFGDFHEKENSQIFDVVGAGFEFNKMIYSNNLFDLRFNANAEGKLSTDKPNKGKVELGMSLNNDYVGTCFGLIGEEPTSHVYVGARAGVGTEHFALAAGIDLASSDKLDSQIRTSVDVYRNAGDNFEIEAHGGMDFDGIKKAEVEFKFGNNEETQFGFLASVNNKDMTAEYIYKNDPKTSEYYQPTTFGFGPTLYLNETGLEFSVVGSVKCTGNKEEPFSYNGIEARASYTIK